MRTVADRLDLQARAQRFCIAAQGGQLDAVKVPGLHAGDAVHAQLHDACDFHLAQLCFFTQCAQREPARLMLHMASMLGNGLALLLRQYFRIGIRKTHLFHRFSRSFWLSTFSSLRLLLQSGQANDYDALAARRSGELWAKSRLRHEGPETIAMESARTLTRARRTPVNRQEVACSPCGVHATSWSEAVSRRLTSLQ